MFKVNTQREKQTNPQDELLQLADPAQFSQALDELWEGWLTNETTDTASAAERAEMLYLYKGLRKFINQI